MVLCGCSTTSVCPSPPNSLLQQIELLPPITDKDSIKEAELINYLINTMQQYNAARSQCNLLIKWHLQEK